MNQSLQPIIERYVADLEHEDGVSERSAEIRSRLTSLMFADALRRKVILCDEHPDHPLQMVIVGPTQVGKSTLVNLLLGLENTEPSARAGFTVHCHGFACSVGDEQWLSSFFTDMKCQPRDALQRNVLDEYSYTDISERISGSVADHLRQAALWDTPDFDSVASFHYRNPVLQAIALSDLVIMVVSKEKYADKSVWDSLSTLALAGKKVVFVMNKTPPQVRAELAASVNSKYRPILAKYPATVVPELFFLDEVDKPHQSLVNSPEVTAFGNYIEKNLVRSTAKVTRRGLDQLVKAHWADWVEPISAQHALQHHWKQLVQITSASLVSRYEKEFLQNDSRHRETFQLAVAELLVLLEVPGMAEPLTKLRNLVTWPVRKVISTATGNSVTGENKKDKRSEERRLLEGLLDHGLTKLSMQLSERMVEGEWWQVLGENMRGSCAAITKGYNNELDNYQTLLKVETERAARALYTKLQDQPATLNSLRAARVSADTAAVVLAVKSGGLGVVDLVIAPAMLSVTTMLTESALGQYMKKVQQDLKDYQKKAVTSLINRKFSMKLSALAHNPGISPEQLEQTARHFKVMQPKVADD